MAFAVIQYIFYDPTTKNKMNEYGLADKLVKSIKYHKLISSQAMDIILHTITNMMTNQEFVDQLNFFRCREQLDKTIPELTPQQQASAKNISGHLVMVSGVIEMAQSNKKDESKTESENMQKVLSSMQMMQGQQAGKGTTEKTVEEKTTEESKPTERVTKDMLNLPGFSDVVHTNSTINMNDAAILAELNTKKEKRRLIVQEMYTTEKTYVTQMEKFISVMMPVVIKLMPEAESMFGNYPNIYEIHKGFFKKLEERFNQQKNEPLIMVSDLFNEFFKDKRLEPEYLKYLTQSEEALKYNFSAYSPQLKEQIVQWSRNCLMMANFLILPVQRLPRYILLLETLLKSTPEIVQDEYHALKEVYNLGKKVTTEIDQEKKKLVKAQALMRYSRTIVGYTSPNNRQFVREAFLTVKTKSKMKGTAVLMSDILYILAQKKTMYTIKNTTTLQGATVVGDSSDCAKRIITVTPKNPKDRKSVV